MRQYINHFAFAFRVMAKSPVITILSVVVLSIAIAQVTLMFNMIESVIWRGLPYKDSERLYRVERVNPQSEFSNGNFPHQTYHEFVDGSGSIFEDTMAIFNDNLIVNYGESGENFSGAYVSPNFLEMLGVTPVMGRAFKAEDADPNAEPVMIISYERWVEFFAKDPAIIGKSISADGVFRTIVGVTPPAFDFPFTNDSWVPLNTDTITQQVGWGNTVLLLGKLNETLRLEAAQEQLTEVFKRVKDSLPAENESFESIRLQNFKELFINDQTRLLFYAMGICAILVLMMSCAIVSNLITVRSVRRSSELAIRSALGASRRQIINQMLFESLIISVLSFAFGWLLMNWFHTAVLADYYNQFNVPSWFFNESYNAKHFVFTIIIPLMVTVASTLVPAFRASRTSLNDLLKDSSRTGSSLKMTFLGRLLIIFQIAAACAVVTGGGIVGYFIHDINNQEQFYDPEDFLYAQIGMDANMYDSNQERAVMLKDVLREIGAHPEVEGVAYSTELFTGGITTSLQIVGEDYPSPDAYPVFYRWVVSPGYFQLMNVPIIMGRGFNEFDTKDHPYVAVITDVFAQQIFGSENPIGKQMIYRDGNDEWTINVVGVCKEPFPSDRDRNQRTGFFLSAYQDVWFDFGIHMKIPQNPKQFESKLISTVAQVDSRVVVTQVQTFNERTAQFTLSLRFIFVLFLTFSIGALVMAAAGLYGVVSFSVSQKIREIGIRLAMGASPLAMIVRTFRQGFLNVIIGVVFGVLGALGIRFVLAMILQPLFESMLVYMAILLSILLVSSLAILIPAVRGGNTDPAEALRID
jgi:predicted permease